jgi:hypothetical protein
MSVARRSVALAFTSWRHTICSVGSNWRAIRPNPALNEPADADQYWNALSLPLVRRVEHQGPRLSSCSETRNRLFHRGFLDKH